jgi:hypothetical protein
MRPHHQLRLFIVALSSQAAIEVPFDSDDRIQEMAVTA